MLGSTPLERPLLMEQLAHELPLFQDAAYAVDAAAAAVLALSREELRCADRLRHAALTERELSKQTGLPRSVVQAARSRLELAGYVRRVFGRRPTSRFELTQYAREWIADLWEPIHDEGVGWLTSLTTDELATIVSFLRRGRALQERHSVRIRRLLDDPEKRPRPNRRRGGLSPAALRRVQVYIAAHLDRRVQIRQLAERARLSPFHFARAFNVSVGTTPRAYVERQRVERATELMRDSSLPLARIALLCGFGTQSRFTTAFRRATGFTPARFRRDASPTALPRSIRESAARCDKTPEAF